MFYRAMWLTLLAASPVIAEPDLSSPKTAAKSFYQAVSAQDADAIREVFYAPGDDERALARSFADLIVATKNLGGAAKAKYGASGDALGVSMIGKDEFAKLDAAEVKESGDSATLTPVGAGKPLTFHRAGGKWQLVLTDFAGTTDGGVPQQVVLLKRVTKVLGDMAVEIEAGKHPTAQDAEAAIQQRLAGAMIAAARAATGPATVPTTKP